ncbi:hypothetical protein E8E14_000134 [Neopestalotiopsis sp. 37M]|nr:hypothetical protein E8E14_000134 [Neopestalotiopsis sp. 37M]
MQSIDKVYDDAVASGLLPGYSLAAEDKEGNVIYSRSSGRASLRGNDESPFTSSTVCAIASMSKLVTSVAVMQAVEDGILDLDADARKLLPRMGEHGVITGFADDSNSAQLEPNADPISLRMLLTHTSGHEYDWMSPLLGKWRASRNEEPWTGPTVEHKSVLPLVFAPGTAFAYGAGHDWAGKLVEIAAKTTLEEFMSKRIWGPLGIQDEISFYPHKNEKMKDRLATISTLNEKGEAPAVDAATFDILFGGTDCLGGAGLFASQKGYQTFLTAVLRRDSSILKPESWTELFRPQLDEKLEQALNDYIALDPVHTMLLGLGMPASVRRNWSFAGIVTKQAQEGRFSSGTTMWAGVPSTVWFIDHEAGVCGTAMCQILPPLHPAIMALHEKFQSGVFEKVTGNAK